MLRIIEQKFNLIDKSKWPRGKWNKEPDLVRLIDEETWRPCLIRRTVLGILCGYVAVHEPSRLYGKHYDEVPDVDIELTYSGYIEVVVGRLWFLGFDHGHFMDIIPAFVYLGIVNSGKYSETYKNIRYVIKELESLVKQINTIEHDSRN